MNQIVGRLRSRRSGSANRNLTQKDTCHACSSNQQRSDSSHIVTQMYHKKSTDYDRDYDRKCPVLSSFDLISIIIQFLLGQSDAVFVPAFIHLHLMTRGDLRNGKYAILRLHEFELLLFIKFEISFSRTGNKRIPTFGFS